MVNVQELQNKPISEIVKVLEIEDSVPLDLTKLAHTLNVSVLGKDFGATRIDGEKIICAFVTNCKGNSCIFYRCEFLSNTAQIMIARTFAKYIITGNNNFFITQSTKFSEREKMLTYEMLMPESQVKDVVDKLILPTTYVLADIFHVSQEFVKQRLDKMHVNRQIGNYHY